MPNRIGTIQHHNPWLSDFLSQEDVIREVFTFLQLDDQKPFEHQGAGRKHLLSAALTCKSFLEPALEQLWRVLNSWHPLLSLLPSYTRVDGVYILGAVRPTEWELFDRRAGCVRTLSFKNDQFERSFAAYLFEQLQSLRLYNILPLLKKLSVGLHAISASFADGIFLAVSPSLQAVTLDNIHREDNYFVIALLSSLKEKSTSLRSLSLAGCLSQKIMVAAFELISLQKLMLDIKISSEYTSDVFVTIGDMALLAELDIVFDQYSFRNQSILQCPSTIDSSRLQNLHRLSIQGPQLAMLQGLHHIRATHVNYVNLVITGHADALIAQTYWVSLFSHVALSSNLIGMDFTCEAHPVPELSGSSLIPVFCLRKIASFSINHVFLTLSNNNIQILASSWQDLQILRLPPYWREGLELPGLSSLHVLAHGCGKLEHLEICLQLNSIPVRPRDNTHAPLLEALSISNLGFPYDCNILINLSRYIDHIFPNVGEIRSSTPYGVPNAMETATLWSQVNQMVQEFQNIRRETRQESFGRIHENIPTIDVEILRSALDI